MREAHADRYWAALGSWPHLPALKHNLVVATAELVSVPLP